MAAAMGGKLPGPASGTVPANAYTTESNPIVVIGEQYIAPYPVDLKIQHTVFTVTENNFDITDVNDNPIFKVKNKLFSFPDRRVLLDAAGNPLVSLKQKILSVHRRWRVFRGESDKSIDFLFSVRKSSLVHLKMRTKTTMTKTLDVFLASNTSESQPDFKIKEGWRDSSCTIFAGDAIIAQMQRKQNVKSLVINADNYGITAYPNVDYAFVVALVVILDEMNRNSYD
ncbi:protein LURP-one-related 10-like [Gossypium australe]|uniref:Protein LURP-one-related 10-like n=1 Tax=Gossypium australe TaxID=47621 RepID=A0A5B6WG52_9ROSI|nr:protein LURP-one-related 10-like [Gossypium australe]